MRVMSVSAVLASAARNALLNFLCSCDDQIQPRHLNCVCDGELSAEHVCRLASDIWGKMCDIQDLSLPMLHSGYLKLYASRHPKIDFDLIMVDEAQDCDPVTMQVISYQKVPKILVGDSHQQIYQFRGAVDAMKLVDASNSVRLSRTFRFGFNIAFVANCILKLKLEAAPIFCARHNDRVSCLSNSGVSSVAVIFRSNENLMEYAIQELKHGECRIAFVGGIDSYPWQKMNDVYALKHNRHNLISDPFIRNFESFAKFKEFVQSSQDPEYLTVVKLVERYDAQCPQIIAQLRDRAAHSERGKCVVLTTAHKSKGLEFDHVKLGDDFIDLHENRVALSGPLGESLVQELNILYVAISRARYSLEIPSKLKRFLASQGYLIEQPRLFFPNEEDCSGSPASCVNCSVKPAYGKRFFRVGSSKMVCFGSSDGAFCRDCFHEHFAWLAEQIDMAQ